MFNKNSISNNLRLKRNGLAICLFFVVFQLAYSQTDHSTRNNYTGSWEAPLSWEPAWNEPQTDSIDFNITINGYISSGASISVSGNTNTLTVNDTLIICGDLALANKSSLVINRNGILFVFGNLVTNNKTTITLDTGAYIVVSGDYIKYGTTAKGSFISNNIPSDVFVGGTIETGLDPILFPVFNCPGSSPYDSSQCSYGNMQDLMNDPIYSFYQSVLSPSAPIITSSGSLTFCEGDSVILTASEGTNYIWSTGETTASIVVNTPGSYSVCVTNLFVCPSSIDSTEVVITVNSLPVAQIAITENSGMENNDGIICQGTIATLIASGGANYSWSTGATSAEIATDIAGTYTVTVTDTNGCSNTTNDTIIILSVPIVNAGTGGDVCGSSYILNASSNIGTGTWAVTSGEGDATFSPDANDPSATISITNFGNYQLSWTAVYENCPASSDVTITFHKVPVANAGADQELNTRNSTAMDAELLSSETGVWSLITGSGAIDDITSPVSEVIDLEQGENIFLWTVSSLYCSASDTVVILVNITDLFVPQVITPNGDGKNDFLIIDGIENFSPAELIIINRWGDEVITYPDYSNNWDGVNSKGSELSNDTYYYTLKLANGSVLKGFVVIKK